MYYFVYVLKSDKDTNYYAGYIHDLKKRMALHSNGKVRSPQNRLPLKLVYFEGCLNQQDAAKRAK